MRVMTYWPLEERADGPEGFRFALVSEQAGKENQVIAWIADRDDADFIYHMRGKLPGIREQLNTVLHYMHDLERFADSKR